MSLTTPNKSAAAVAQDSPGTWRHPRLQEITRRRDRTNFTDKNVQRILINAVALAGLFLVDQTISSYIPFPPRRTNPNFYLTVFWLRIFLYAIPVINSALNLLPLMRKQDDCSDIPLTPGQRKLLGLPPASGPPTPGSVYSTPPRYSRTPSIGSAGSRRSISSSPLSNNGSPSNKGSPGSGGGMPVFGSPGSPLLQKAMSGARRSSLGSLGSPSPRGASSGASLFGGGPPDSPSPSPAAGKRSSVGLNNKWLYERGRNRRSSGNLLSYS